jgi:hypothetical protein
MAIDIIGYKVLYRDPHGGLWSPMAPAPLLYAPGLVTEEPAGPEWGALAVFQTERQAVSWNRVSCEVWEVVWAPSDRRYLKAPQVPGIEGYLPPGTCFARAVRPVRRVATWDEEVVS